MLQLVRFLCKLVIISILQKGKNEMKAKLNWKKVIGWGVVALVVIGVVGTNMYNQQKK